MTYPNASNAIEICEALRQWPMYRGLAAQHTVEYAHARMREDLAGAIDRCNAAGQTDRAQVLSQALIEWDYPQFMEYFRAKVTSDD